jgi:alpha-D-xyloside xylohydrolase
MRYLLFFLISIIAPPAISQNVTQTNNGINTIIDGLNIEIQFYNSQIVRILKSPAGLEHRKKSLSVIKIPEAVNVAIAQQNNAVTIKSDALIVELDLQTGKVSYHNTAGKLLLTEKDYGTQFTPVVDVKKKPSLYDRLSG